MIGQNGRAIGMTCFYILLVVFLTFGFFALLASYLKLTVITSSAEYPDYYPTGSLLFSQPGEVDLWCQSVDFGGGFPPTPPDSLFDCAVSDSAEIMSQPWGQDPLPEEPWTIGPALVNSTGAQPSGSDWHNQEVSQTTQDVRVVDPSTWLNVSHGSVGTGSSPALSYSSQSSRTLYPLSEPDVAMLPSGLDLSFATDPGWIPNFPSMTQSSQGLQIPVPDGILGHPPPQAQYGTHMANQVRLTAPQPGPVQMHHPMHLGRGHFVPPRYTPVISRRPLLPRTEESVVPSQPVYGPQRVLRPQMPVSQSSQSSISTVSSTSGQLYGPVMPQHNSLSGPDRVPVSSTSVHKLLPAGEGPSATFRSGSETHVGSTGHVGHYDPAEDWSSFVHLEQEVPITSTGSFRSGLNLSRTYEYRTN